MVDRPPGHTADRWLSAARHALAEYSVVVADVAASNRVAVESSRESIRESMLLLKFLGRSPWAPRGDAS
jgi:hypothetical protein